MTCCRGTSSFRNAYCRVLVSCIRGVVELLVDNYFACCESSSVVRHVGALRHDAHATDGRCRENCRERVDPQTSLVLQATCEGCEDGVFAEWSYQLYDSDSNTFVSQTLNNVTHQGSVQPQSQINNYM